MVVTSSGRTVALEAETFSRDGDWILLTKAAPQMEPRTINHPEQFGTAESPEYKPARTETVMVSTGRMVQQPIACFYKPESIELREPSDGNDA
jgi:hypothetical protein